MSNKGGKMTTNKLMNFARRLPAQGAPKRPMQGSPAGPPSKKLASSLAGSMGRKPEEGIKDKKPLFELPSAWRELAEGDTITGSEFDAKKEEIIKKAESTAEPESAGTSEGEDKKESVAKNSVEKFVLIALRSLAESSRGDAELTQKLLQFIISEAKNCKSPYILHGLFESFSFIDAKENIPIICQAISAIFNSITTITPFMFELVLNDSCGKRFFVDSSEAAPIYYGIMMGFGDFVVPTEELYEKAELITLKRTFVNTSTLERKVNPSSAAFSELIPTTLNMICQRCQEEPTKGIIRTAAFLVNNPDIKSVILKKLDTWLQAIALQRCAPETIIFLCVNTPTLNDEKGLQTIRDLLTLHSLQKKQHQTVLLACMDYWLNADRKNLDALVSVILDLEFSPKQQQKMPHLYMLLQYLYFKNVEETSKIVTNKLVSALINPKTVRLVRNFLKEFTKAGFRVDFQFGVFAKYIFEAVRIRINERALFNDDFNAVDLLKNAINVCSILPITAVSTSVKDAGNIRRSGGNLNPFQSGSLNRFQSQIQQFFVFSSEFLKWISITEVNINEVILMEFYDQLFYLNGNQSKNFTASSDGWPTEHDYISGLKMIHESTVDESVLFSLINAPDFSAVDQNIIRTVSYSPVLQVEILERLTQRLLNFKSFENDSSLLSIKSINILENLFNLASISSFPQLHSIENKTGNVIGIKNLYLRCWKLAITWTLMSRNSILSESYSNFPMMKFAFHMALTKSDFPLTQFENKSGNQISSDDIQEGKRESEVISKFFKEKEKSVQSLFHSRLDLCTINPKGPPRNFADVYIHFCKLKEVGAVLCGIRNPDLLKELAKDNLTDQARSSIHDAISRNNNIIEELPILTIGNIFLEDSGKLNEFSKVDEARNMPIKKRLKEALMKRTSDEKEIITFFVSKLCSDSTEERKAALNAIQDLIGDESTKNSKIDSLSKLPAFENYREYICRELSHAITIESDMERILNLIGFITKNGVKEGGIFHIVAMRLTMIIERAGSGDSVAHRNVQNSLLEFFVNYLTAASEGEKPPFGSTDFDYGEPLKVKIPKFAKEFVISSKVLTGMMTLLCEGSDEGAKNQNREFLLNALFGDGKQKLTVVRVSDGSKVDVLPEELRKRMLTSADERIVKAALDGITVERALQFLQSFAITAVAYSQLLTLVNSSKPPIEEAKKAATFVRAYKLKGAKGADEFLKYVENESDDMAVDEKPLKKIPLDPLPKVETFEKVKIGKSKPLNSSEAIKIFEKMLNSKLNPMEIVLTDDWKAYTEALKDENIAKECVAVIMKMNNPKDIHFVIRMTLLSLIDQARTDDSYKKIVASLANSFVGTHPDFKFFIEKFSTTEVKKSKKEFQNADEILNELSKNGGQLAPHALNNLLYRFRRFRPEIVDSGLSDEDFHKQVLDLFKNDNSAIRNLIEILAASTIQSTVTKVVSCLLQTFEISVSPVLVIEFIDKCVKSQEEERKIVPNSSQCIVLIDYVIADMAFERPSSTDVPEFLIVLEAVMEEYGYVEFEKILHAISEKIETALTPPMDEPHFLILNKLVDTLGKKFCGCREVVESYQNDGKIRYQKIIPKSLQKINKEVFFAISELREAIESQDEKRLNNSYMNMKYQIDNNPHVVADNIPLLTTRIIPILSMTKREYKDQQFLRYLESTLDTVLSTIKYAAKNPRDLDQFLKVFIEFFYSRITASHRFKQIFNLLVQICLKYLILNPTAAKKILRKEDHIFIFKSMQQIYADNTFLNSLLRHLENEQEA